MQTEGGAIANLQEDREAIIARLRRELENGETKARSKLFSFRLDEETQRGLEAEARLTSKTVSQVMRDRVKRRILVELEGNTKKHEIEAGFRRMRLDLMLRIVEMSDEALAERRDFMKDRQIDDRARDEFALYEKEISLRKAERRKAEHNENLDAELSEAIAELDVDSKRKLLALARSTRTAV